MGLMCSFLPERKMCKHPEHRQRHYRRMQGDTKILGNASEQTKKNGVFRKRKRYLAKESKTGESKKEGRA